MQTQGGAVISIHPNPAEPLTLDVKDILSALGARQESWKWCVRNLDWLGQDGEDFCRRVEAAGPTGLWLTSDELLGHARGIYQTVEGEFFAFPRAVDPKTVGADELDLRAFPASRAELVVVAVDGGAFDVLAKDPEVLAALKKWKGVRDEDPRNYF